jgi:hypothetical protein
MYSRNVSTCSETSEGGKLHKQETDGGEEEVRKQPTNPENLSRHSCAGKDSEIPIPGGNCNGTPSVNAHWRSIHQHYQLLENAQNTILTAMQTNSNTIKETKID